MAKDDVMTHIEAISNGMGAASMWLLVMAAEGQLDARLSITGDTGSELDRLWSDGRRTTAQVYFDDILQPFAQAHGIEAVMVKALDENGAPLPPIIELLERGITAGVPLFGSGGGRLIQACTSKWKIRAVRQELRRRGAISARVALALDLSEVHRMKPSDVQWCANWWPLIDTRRYRASIQEDLNQRGIPYLLTTECDMCPHKDLARWRRSSPETIERAAALEAKFDGLFLTSRRVPLKQALQNWNETLPDNSLFDGCDSGYCMV